MATDLPQDPLHCPRCNGPKRHDQSMCLRCLMEDVPESEPGRPDDPPANMPEAFPDGAD